MVNPNANVSHGKNVPGYVKMIILVQSAIIMIFTVGMYQEYLSNSYLHQYVISILSSDTIAVAVLSMVTASVFALGMFMVLGSMTTSRRENKNWKLMTESADEAMDMPSMPILRVVEPSARKLGSKSRIRRRKSILGTDEIFRSMTTYDESRPE
jgi:hypothetical protein